MMMMMMMMELEGNPPAGGLPNREWALYLQPKKELVLTQIDVTRSACLCDLASCFLLDNFYLLDVSLDVFVICGVHVPCGIII